MKNIISFIKDCFKDEYIIEMATIGRNVKLDNKHQYKIAIHGPSSKDREYPHIHIYDANDNTLKNFNFEISLVDLICFDELNLICQVDKQKYIKNTHRKNCSWTAYKDLKDNFEDWLYSESNVPGDFIDNVDAIIWSINNESPAYYDNFVLDYIKRQGLKVSSNFEKYFSEDDKKTYSECFN